MLEPQWDTKGNRKPVTGTVDRFIPTFSKIWNVNQQAKPIASIPLQASRASSAIISVRRTSRPSRPGRPGRPGTSPTPRCPGTRVPPATEKVKSVLERIETAQCLRPLQEPLAGTGCDTHLAHPVAVRLPQFIEYPQGVQYPEPANSR